MSMLEQCQSIARRALLQAFRFSNARTYARTHRDLLTLLCYLPLVIARRGAGRFTSMGERSERTVGASRDLSECNHQEAQHA